jgi:hypothetical protein
MCCRLASPIQCPQSYSTLMVNNSPKLCSIAARQINNISPSNPSDGIIHQQQPTSSISSTGHNNNNNLCPTGYTCMQSSVVSFM